MIENPKVGMRVRILVEKKRICDANQTGRITNLIGPDKVRVVFDYTLYIAASVDFKLHQLRELNPIPPDPDGQNNNRAIWADYAILEFRKATGTDPGDALADLLCDLMHWDDRNQQDFENALARAYGHYREETRKPITEE